MKNDLVSDTDNRLVNRELTRKLCKLHSSGYDLDFCIANDNYLRCMQDQENFPRDCIIVNLVDQIYDFFSNSYKYVHTVDTICGKKGILLLERIYGL